MGYATQPIPCCVAFPRGAVIEPWVIYLWDLTSSFCLCTRPHFEGFVLVTLLSDPTGVGRPQPWPVGFGARAYTRPLFSTT
jgi:hypothetical protein